MTTQKLDNIRTHRSARSSEGAGASGDKLLSPIEETVLSIGRHKANFGMGPTKCFNLLEDVFFSRRGCITEGVVSSDRSSQGLRIQSQASPQSSSPEGSLGFVSITFGTVVLEAALVVLANFFAPKPEPTCPVVVLLIAF